MTHELINLIDGEWVTSDDKSTNINPANVEEVIAFMRAQVQATFLMLKLPI